MLVVHWDLGKTTYVMAKMSARIIGKIAMTIQEHLHWSLRNQSVHMLLPPRPQLKRLVGTAQGPGPVLKDVVASQVAAPQFHEDKEICIHLLRSVGAVVEGNLSVHRITRCVLLHKASLEPHCSGVSATLALWCICKPVWKVVQPTLDLGAWLCMAQHQRTLAWQNGGQVLYSSPDVKAPCDLQIDSLVELETMAKTKNVQQTVWAVATGALPKMKWLTMRSAGSGWRF